MEYAKSSVDWMTFVDGELVFALFIVVCPPSAVTVFLSEGST